MRAVKKKLALAYVAALHVALAVALAKTDLIERVQVRLGMRAPAEWSGLVSMRVVLAAQDATVPDGAVIFLGDSITQALATAAVAPLSVNFGISGQRSDQLNASMDSYRSLSRAGAVVVAIGVNDIRQGRSDGIEHRYRAILGKIPPSVPVVMSSVTPIRGVDVSQVVEAGRRACSERPLCRFVDASIIPADALMTDGVHLSPRGYTAWIELLRAGLRHHTTVTPRAA
jgi:lysophospholipase L1-like esterase